MHQIRSTHPITWSSKNKLQNTRAENSPNYIFPRQIKGSAVAAHWSQTDCFKESECADCDSSMIADRLEATKPHIFDAEGFRVKITKSYSLIPILHWKFEIQLTFCIHYWGKLWCFPSLELMASFVLYSSWIVSVIINCVADTCQSFQLLIEHSL